MTIKATLAGMVVAGVAWSFAPLLNLSAQTSGDTPTNPYVIDTTGINTDWESRASLPSQGRIIERDGKRIQQRYEFGGFGETYHGQWATHAYETVANPEPRRVEMPRDIAGDPEKGHALFKDRGKGPCYACHVVPDATIWPAGNVGPDLRAIGYRNLPDSYLYQLIYDARAIFGLDSPMPPFGTSGMWTEEEIVHVVAYLQSLKGDPPGTPDRVTDDRQWDPRTRDVVRPDYGHPLDPLDNPALGVTETVAVPLWNQVGPKGESCASCHGTLEAPDELRSLGVIPEFARVGATYPKWFDEYRRMMSVEDFLAVHAPDTTGIEMPAQDQENLAMSILVRMQSNGKPYELDTGNPNVQAAIKRGEQLFHRPVGQRNHSCADCHTPRGGADKFLGGRFLANVDDGMLNHPYWRTAQQRIWDARIRMQWCMTPLGTNYLPGDAPEYADLETYIIFKQQGTEVLVPRQSH
jgi:L-cysteine S-thiosulfotransferase